VLEEVLPEMPAVASGPHAGGGDALGPILVGMRRGYIYGRHVYFHTTRPSPRDRLVFISTQMAGIPASPRTWRAHRCWTADLLTVCGDHNGFTTARASSTGGNKSARWCGCICRPMPKLLAWPKRRSGNELCKPHCF